MTITLGTIPLVESIMTDINQAKWARLPPGAALQDVVEARGSVWRVVVGRWKMGDTFHFEGVASSKTPLKNSPLVVRLPPTDAERAWKQAEAHLPI